MSAGPINGFAGRCPGSAVETSAIPGTSHNVGIAGGDIGNDGPNHPSAAEASPEVLGSVVQSHGPENGERNSCVPLRTSARVSKKMRLDFIASQTPPDKKDVPKEEEKQDVKPKRRSWELWPLEDKNTFFEALNEYGKDFDAIQKYFEAKAKRKNIPEHLVKNKEQIRHFYYRTWHKISKHLRFPDEVKKATQELYGLINFGELRKKVGGVSEKTSLKLNELIYRGFTQIRVRGKTLRIKTPICRALRKLNQQEELTEEIKLPTRVTVELRPRTNEAWARVQAIAQNPRLVTLLPLQRRLSTLISFLQQRWQLYPQKHCERLQSQLDEVNSSINKIMESCPASASAGATSTSGEEKTPGLLDGDDAAAPKNPVPSPQSRFKSNQVLRVAPPSDSTIIPLTVNLSEYFTSTRLSLNSHEERLGNHAAEEMFNSMLVASGKSYGKRGAKRQRHDSSSEKKKEQTLQNQHVQFDSSPEKSKDSTASLASSLPGVSIANDAEDVKPSCPFRLFGSGVSLDASSISVDSGHGDSKVNGDQSVKSPVLPKADSDQVGGGGLRSGPSVVDSSVSPTSAPVSLGVLGSAGGESPEEVISRVRMGWTLNNVKAVAIGELYLMFGAESKLVLEYWWEDPPPSDSSASSDSVLTKSPNPSVTSPTNSGTSGSTVNESSNKSDTSGKEQLALTLQKLISIAKMHSTKKKPVQCPCGHVCNGTPKTSAPKPKVPKPVRFNVESELPKLQRSDSSTEIRTEQTHTAIVRTPISQHDGPFRRPLMPSPQFKPPPRPGTVDAFKAQLEKFRPRFCNRRGRPASVRKNVVVPRMLPLLPKAPAQEVLPERGQLKRQFLPSTQSPSVLNFSPTPANIAIIRPQSRKITGNPGVTAPVSAITSTPSHIFSTAQTLPPVESISLPNLFEGGNQTETQQQLEMHNNGMAEMQNSRVAQDLFPPTLETPVSSPPSISNLLDISLPSELNLNPNPLMETNFTGLLSSNSGLSSSPPPASPSTILKEDENQWLNSEVVDFSLSSFLGHLESPIKTSTSSSQDLTDNTSDVEAQMQCLMTENSLDYMAKFADLAAQIASDGNSKN